ncbi:MAG: metallophosphoesterase [Nanoarchaeota archaeon]|nr:metallophosphoesterase [Nanoarchaeota archaeon]
MEISKNIEIIGTALWLTKEKALIINDLHLGYEEALHRKGVLVPKFQIQEIIALMEKILRSVKPKTIIINGDLKHEFGTILHQEWKEILQFLDFCAARCAEIVIIKGNHDPIITAITTKRNIKVVTEYKTGDVLIIHGDKLVKTKAKTIIIGHEHPAITLQYQSKREKFKCFLHGKWQGKELIAVPSFKPLLEGTDILKEQVLSPFLTNLSSYTVYITHQGNVFPFGTVKEIQKLSDKKSVQLL